MSGEPVWIQTGAWWAMPPWQHVVLLTFLRPLYLLRGRWHQLRQALALRFPDRIKPWGAERPEGFMPFKPAFFYEIQCGLFDCRVGRMYRWEESDDR